MNTYKCKTCEQIKPLTEFAIKTTKLGHNKECKPCWAMAMRQYYKDHPEAYTKHKTYVKKNDAKYKRAPVRHGIGDEKHKELLKKFDGLCHACRARPATAIDHDHKCCPGTYSCGGCVRGVLCNGCNTSIGLMSENLKYIQSLMEYLKT